MSKTTIQIPVELELREKVEIAAANAGFSSVQELVRVFLNKFSKRTIDIAFYEKGVALSKKAESRYLKMIKDARVGKNITKPKSFNELISLLY